MKYDVLSELFLIRMYQAALVGASVGAARTARWAAVRAPCRSKPQPCAAQLAAAVAAAAAASSASSVSNSATKKRLFGPLAGRCFLHAAR